MPLKKLKGKYKLTPPFYPLDPEPFCLDDSIFYYVTVTNLRKRFASVNVFEGGVSSINGTELDELAVEERVAELRKRQGASVSNCYAPCGMYTHRPLQCAEIKS
jgi:hypothetical protein